MEKTAIERHIENKIERLREERKELNHSIAVCTKLGHDLQASVFRKDIQWIGAMIDQLDEILSKIQKSKTA